MFDIYISGKTAKKGEDTLGIAELAAELGKQSVEPSDTTPALFSNLFSFFLYTKDLILVCVAIYSPLRERCKHTITKHVLDKLKWVVSSRAVKPLTEHDDFIV